MYVSGRLATHSLNYDKVAAIESPNWELIATLELKYYLLFSQLISSDFFIIMNLAHIMVVIYSYWLFSYSKIRIDTLDLFKVYRIFMRIMMSFCITINGFNPQIES